MAASRLLNLCSRDLLALCQDKMERMSYVRVSTRFGWFRVPAGQRLQGLSDGSPVLVVWNAILSSVAAIGDIYQ